MTREQVDKIVEQLATDRKIDASGMNHEDLVYIAEHFDELREWAENERRIERLQAELRTVNTTRDDIRNSLLLLLPDNAADGGIGWSWRDEASVRQLACHGMSEEIRKQATEELARRHAARPNGERRFTKRPTTEGDLR